MNISKTKNNYKKLYLEFCKDILKENPDSIYWDDEEINWIDDRALSTMVLYNDIKDHEIHYLSKQYNDSGFITNALILSDNKGVIDDVYTAEEKLDEPLGNTHYNLISMLSIMNRFPRIDKSPFNRNVALIMSRLYYVGHDKHILTFWQNQNTVKRYKNWIDSYLQDVGLIPEDILYQSSSQSSETFLSYDEFYNGITNKNSSAEEEKNKIAQELHVKKALLDKAILNVIASKPKNINDLYSSLETQLNMPIVKIKHVFGDIPLNLLFKKTLAEMIDYSRKI